MIDMHNRHLQSSKEEKLSKEKLLVPSSISIGIDIFAQPEKHSTITNLSVDIEPLELKVGFREIDNFKGLAELVLDLVDKLQPSDKDEDIDLEEFEKQEAFNHAAAKNLLKQNAVEMIKEVREKAKEDEKEVDAKKPLSLKELFYKNELRDLRKRKYFKTHYNEMNLMNVYLVLGSLSLSLMDDTGLQEHPLVSFDIKKVYVVYSSENGQDNVITHMIRKMGLYKYPVQKMRAELYLSSSYFNIDNGNFEPLIETWKLQAEMNQREKTSLMYVKAFSKDMLNINLTYGVALAINQIKNRMEQTEEDWMNEVKIQNYKLKQRDVLIKKSKTSYLGMGAKVDSFTPKLDTIIKDEGDSGFIFENNLDLPMRITLEGYDQNKDIEIKDINDSSVRASDAVLDFKEQVNEDGHFYRSFAALKKINKIWKKALNRNQPYMLIKDPDIKIDIYIEGMEAIKGVPIEVSGRRSFELTISDDHDKSDRKNRYQFVFILDISQEGLNKIVSFESQVIITNETEFEIEVAHVLLEDPNSCPKQLTEYEINNRKAIANQIDKSKRTTMFQALLETQNEVINTIKPNEELRIPLLWFLEDIAIYYK